MGEKDTDKGKSTGNPSDDPKDTSKSNPDPAEELRQENEKLKAESLAKDDQLTQKDQYISNLSTEKATLEERAKTVSPPTSGELDGRIANVLEKAQTDPQEAGKELAKLIQDATTKAQKDTINQAMATIAPTVERTAYANEVRKANKDLMDLGFEPVISNRAQELSKTGLNFNQAVDKAVKETREKVDKLKSNTSTPPPGGSQGEGGGNPPPVTPPVVKEPTAQDEINARQSERRSRGLE